MERYTEKHYTGNGHYLICSGTCETLNCGDCGVLDKIVNRLAAYEDTGLAPEEVQQMRWIPVEERLPGVSGNYICAVNDKHGSVWTIPAEWSLEMKTWFGAFGEIKNKVTHWTPLPEAPKEEKE